MPNKPKATEIDPRLQRYLGNGLTTRTFELGTRTIVGYRAPTDLDADAVEPISIELARDDLCLFLSTNDDGPELVAVPGIAPADIAELVQVGTHNANDPDAWRKVKSALAKIHKRAPFDVPFADSAGLIGVFRKKPSLAIARAIADIFGDEVSGGLEAMESIVARVEIEDEELDDDLSPEQEDERRGFATQFPRYLKDHGRFHLWWD